MKRWIARIIYYGLNTIFVLLVSTLLLGGLIFICKGSWSELKFRRVSLSDT